MFALGFSINVLTMFGMVLAIGILVDDAIVVVENVERIMSEEGLSPREATRKAMGQITGAIIGITLVLMAVFVPMAFFPGSVGSIYRQFSVTMVSLDAVLGVPGADADAGAVRDLPEAGRGRPPAREARASSAGSTAASTRTTHALRGRGRDDAAPHRPLPAAVRRARRRRRPGCSLRLPASFLPNEDQGYIIVNVQLPPGATQRAHAGR